MKRLVFLTFIFFFNIIKAQDLTIESRLLPKRQEISNLLSNYDIFEIDVEKVRNEFRTSTQSGIEADLILADKVFRIQAFKYNVLKQDCNVRIISDQGDFNEKPDPSIETYRGYNTNFGGGEVVITFATNYMSLMYKDGGEYFYLEQFPELLKDNNKNLFIRYTRQSFKFQGFKCNYQSALEFKESQIDKFDSDKFDERNIRCFEVEIAMACDFPFFTKHGGNRADAEARLTTIVNLIQPDWVYPKLNYDYFWTIPSMAIVESAARDPFAPATNINSLLSIFTGIGFTIFQGSFDVATVWTSKFTATPHYASNQRQACLFSMFSACNEISTNGTFIRNVQSHALGHLFDAPHDAGPFIMDPNIGGNTNWTKISADFIQGWTDRITGCLGECSGPKIPIAEFTSDVVEGCIPLQVQYTNMSTNATNYIWKFPGGTPSSSTLKDPLVTYNTLGVFAVELEALNSKCSTKVEKLGYIATRDKPRFVRFNFGAVNNGNDIEFFGSADRADTWIWKFHDGTTEEGQYVVKTYDREGSFDVELCASNDCGETCVKQKVSNYYVPTVDFTADKTSGCAPVTVKFEDLSSSNVINWTWSFPGASPNGSFIKNPTVKYSRPGRFPVSLTVHSLKNNAKLKKDTFIIIDSLPLAQFDPVIGGPLVTVNNTSFYADSHFWDFGDGTSSRDSSPTHFYRDGRYEIIYTASNKCGSTTTKRTITIGAKPTAGFSVMNQKGCTPFVVQFQNSSTSSATNFEWLFPGGNPSTSTDKEPIITYSSVGKFDVRLIAKGALESDTLNQKEFITVDEITKADFQNSIIGYVCNFTDLSTNSKTYYWDFGDGTTSSMASPSHDYKVEGDFKVRLITENECGADTMDKLIAIYLIPKVDFSSNVIKGCPPLTVDFLDRSSVDVLEWSWQFENGNPLTSSQKNPSVIFSKPGKYTVKLSVKNSNGTNSSTKIKYIEVLSPIKCPKRPTTKTGVDSTEKENDNLIKISNRENTINSFSIYPIPATDEIYLNAEKGMDFTIFSLTGQKLIVGKTQSSNEKINVQQIPNGTYYIQLSNPYYNSIEKIIINK
ncbi:MAG: PKD domain-containing protein [Saprospiraceae bacterium]|nr:PKD domain-containing protein [Saprospiraceae bacterium]